MYCHFATGRLKKSASVFSSKSRWIEFTTKAVVVSVPQRLISSRHIITTYGEFHFTFVDAPKASAGSSVIKANVSAKRRTNRIANSGDLTWCLSSKPAMARSIYAASAMCSAEK
jgi:hypothetical protein